jgi:poly [ADP-ribose] polymerase
MKGEQLAQVAAREIETNSPETMSLVSYLARVNVHNILQSTTLNYDVSRGTFSTPLGIVTKDAITEARALLGDIGALVHANDWASSAFVPKLNDYLMLVPQNIGRAKPDPRTLFPDLEAVQKQNGILDSLEASLQMVLTAAEEDEKAGNKPAPPRLFEARLHLVDDPAEIKRIQTKYRSTRKDMHVCRHLDVKRVFRVEVGSMARAFDAEGKQVGNVHELWHGTRAGNLLSILKGGFVIPPGNAAHCTGRLFGNGVYFATASTKSLNYAYGYWGSGAADNNCFMFLADVALGKSYVPKYNEALPKPGYDSTWAKPGKSGIQNDEIIVYRTCQINPTYLVEFSPDGK